MKLPPQRNIMQRSDKKLITGIVIGAAVTTAAIIYIAGKVCNSIADIVLTYKEESGVHLFDMQKQGDKEDIIDSLIPTEKPAKTCTQEQTVTNTESIKEE